MSSAVLSQARTAAVLPGPYCEHILGAALSANLPGLVWLRLGATRGADTRYQVLSFSDPDTINIPLISKVSPGTTLQMLDKLLAQLDPDEPPYCGYAVAIQYGAAPFCDDAMPADSPDHTPNNSSRILHPPSFLRVRRIDAAYALDLQTRTATFRFSAAASPTRRQEFQRTIEHVLCIHTSSAPSDPNDLYALTRNPTTCTPDFPPAAYLTEITHLQQHIAAGDLYECNFTQRFRARSSTPPAIIAQRLLATAPARHACYLDFGDTVVISNSPEQFLRVQDAHVATCPIKGSIPRSSDPEIDLAQRNRLAASAKDHAEHTMVLDMARNDLGRICCAGSVEVTVPYAIESHPALHHMVSTVEGELANPNAPMSTVLAATFPAASITGTPKIAAMKAIQQHERSPRGYYTGAIGLLGRDHLDLNVAIRTITATREGDDYHYELGAGGAIVADSIPQDEYAECLAKATPLLNAIGSFDLT